MKKVTIKPGCTSCGTCEFICPQVFHVTDVCHVKKDAPIAQHTQEIQQAAASCPVSVIICEEKKE